jgi:DNA-binding LytR/AlgR family response regulator
VKIVIAEDEAVIARRIARLTCEILGPAVTELTIAPGIDEARSALAAAPDLLILDLNLEGEEGFALLRDSSSGAFDTIVVSAHAERALEAFDYGVRDFVAKPFSRERLERALHRLFTPAARNATPLKFVGIRKRGAIEFLSVDEICYARGAGTHSELVVRNGKTVLHDKSLDRLEGLLPLHFERIHKSYIVDLRRARRLVVREGSRYSLELDDGAVLPVGRTRITALRARLS